MANFSLAKLRAELLKAEWVSLGDDAVLARMREEVTSSDDPDVDHSISADTLLRWSQRGPYAALATGAGDGANSLAARSKCLAMLLRIEKPDCFEPMDPNKPADNKLIADLADANILTAGDRTRWRALRDKTVTRAEALGFRGIELRHIVRARS